MGNRLERTQNRWGVAFAFPAIVFFVGFNIYPAANALWLSLTDWAFSGRPRFVGLTNYVNLMRDRAFLNSFLVTVYFTAASAPLLVMLGLTFAVATNRSFAFRNAYRALLFFPVVAPVVVISILWAYMYHSTYGPINSLLAQFGIPPIPWLTHRSYAVPSLIILNVWRFSGLYMLIFLAGLQDIPEELYDSARIDGASKCQLFSRITLPLLAPTTQLVLIISVIRSFQVFGPALLLTSGGPVDATEVLTLLLYRSAFLYFKMGYSSAIAVVMFGVLIAFSLLQFRLSRNLERS